jgi:hypothetical protein
MIEAKENSFKEFLNEEVDNWEKALYPILDAELLEMSREELKPSLHLSAPLFGIDIDTTKLKQILTPSEAEELIKGIKSEKSVVDDSFDLAIAQLEQNYEAKRREIQNQRSFFARENERIEKQIEKHKESIETLEELYQNEFTILFDEYKRQDAIFKKIIFSLDTQKEEKNALIQTTRQQMRVDKNTFDKTVVELNGKLQEEMKRAEEECILWLKTEQDKIDSSIAQKEEEKKKITKDARLQELEEQKKSIEQELKDSLNAKNFLLSYENVKERISFLPKRENELTVFEMKIKRFKERLNEKIINDTQKWKQLLQRKHDTEEVLKTIEAGINSIEAIQEMIEDVPPQKTDEYLTALIKEYKSLQNEYKDKKINLKTALDKLNRLKNTYHQLDTSFEFDEFDRVELITHVPALLMKIDEIVEFKNKKIETIKQSGHKDFFNFVKNRLPQKISVFSDTEDKFISQVAKINKHLTKIDFGVIKNIRIDTTSDDKKSIAKLLLELNENIADLSSLLNEASLFYDQKEVITELEKLEKKFDQIKHELKGNAISLIDTIDLSLSFTENGTQKTNISQIKNESSTGGSILLKIAIAISILELFISEQKTPFFLIVDEVSRLHSNNQERLRKFANTKGFGIIFVTPEPTYSKPDVIKYYRFTKNNEDQFEVIELNQ